MYVAQKTFATLLGVVLAGLMTSAAVAGDGALQKAGCCADCGLKGGCGQYGLHKVCRLKCEPKTEKITVYKCECEPVCLPCCSKIVGLNSTCVDCDAKGYKGGKGCCGCQKKICWFDFCPRGAKECHKKRLYKKEVEVPIKGAVEYKWEVVDLCKGCKDKAIEDAPAVDPADDIPEPPPVDVQAQLIYGKPVVERMASATR
jgi:hypothetical protein